MKSTDLSHILMKDDWYDWIPYNLQMLKFSKGHKLTRGRIWKSLPWQQTVFPPIFVTFLGRYSPSIPCSWSPVLLSPCSKLTLLYVISASSSSFISLVTISLDLYLKTILLCQLSWPSVFAWPVSSKQVSTSPLKILHIDFEAVTWGSLKICPVTSLIYSAFCH